MTLTKAKENLSELIAKFERELSAGQIKEYNEEAAKIAFIQPLLKDVLGWDVNDHDEVSPEEKTSRGRVDYGLKVDGKIKIFIEAKPPKADLSKHVEQAVRYGYNRKSVPFVLLTDFEGLKLFDVTVKPDSRNPLKGQKIDLERNQYLEQFEKLWLLSKESVSRGELDKLLLIKPKERVPVDKAILDDLKQWREDLAKDIFKNNQHLFHSDDKEKDATYLKEITQRILDRIIFMRSCEDRGLIHRRPLRELFEERTETVGTNTMIFLNEEFKNYNIIFDSDLFSPEEWENNLAVDFKVMRDIVLETYNPYQFDVIPIEVLGNIYEQYLGYTIRLTNHQVKYELKPEVRKAGGVYYTPEYIVDYIVKNTVGKMLQELSPRKIKKLRILDPACGSGSFLIRAYEEMLSYYQGQKTKLLKAEARKRELMLQHEQIDTRLAIKEKSQILREHIHGVDIDEQAVEVTKLSLMLKMLEGEYGIIPGRAILPMLDKNIKCGNSLISGDTLELKKYFGDGWYKVKPFNWEDEFKKIMVDEGGFDVVIGNPPYIRTVKLERDKIYFQQKFFSALGAFDIYILFLEKGISLLKNLGKLSFITPNKFFIADYGKGIRQFILENSQIESIADLAYCKSVFQDALISTTICVFRKILKSLKQYQLKLKVFNDNNILQITSVPFDKVDVQTIIDKDGTIKVYYDITIEKINRRLLSQSEELRKIASVRTGIMGFDYWALESFIHNGKAKGKCQCRIATNSYIDRYKVLWGKSVNIYKKNFTEPYLLLENNKFINESTKDLFLKRKIIVRGVATRLTATLDEEGIGVLVAVHTIISKIYDSRYILGLLNSSLFNWMHLKRFYSARIPEGSLRYPISFLKQLPIHKIDFNNAAKKKLHDEIVTLVDVMLDLNKKIQSAKGSEKEQIQRQIEKTDREIDDLVYKLYNISDEEKKIIEGNNS
jgi:type I restriction-modification system DNA methylase subunit